MGETPPVPFDLPADRLADRVALVTGASRGLGASMAARFAERGLKLALCARALPDLPAGSVGIAATLDVADAAALEGFAAAAEAELGPIALWVSNAGVLEPMGPLRDADPGAIERALLVNVGGVANGSRIFARLARAAPGHRRVLVNVSSGAARSVYEGWATYGATKAAVDHLTEIVAAEEPDLVCHAVAPGVVDTDMQALIRTHDAASFPAIERFRELHRTDSWNDPAWIADHLLGLLAATWRPDEIVVRVPDVPR
ncbi:MAG: SDR family NAD(P)-dependent oxidoreductase [Acidimicrobiales bacterium]|nr:SDR family NAD(P)-dependent oxidoreductase [Acidimicrobiales bacterium]